MTTVAGKSSTYLLNITDQVTQLFSKIAEGYQVSVSNNILI